MTNQELAEAKALLVAAKAKIATPERWTKNALAKNANDLMVHHRSPAACKFCLLGAMRSCQPLRNTDNLAKRLLRNQLPYSFGQFLSLPGYNDDPATTHEDIMRLFDKAIGATT